MTRLTLLDRLRDLFQKHSDTHGNPFLREAIDKLAKFEQAKMPVEDVEKEIRQICVSELHVAPGLADIIRRLAAQNRDLREQEVKLRHLLFMQHSHNGSSACLYGDDGERHCNACMCDFNKDSADLLSQKVFNYAMRQLAAKSPEQAAREQYAELKQLCARAQAAPQCEHKRQKWAANMQHGSCMDCGAELGEKRQAAPVAWIEHHKGGDNLNWERVDYPGAKATPLYAAPAPSVTEAQITKIVDKHFPLVWDVSTRAKDCCREVLALAGIKVLP